MTSIDDFAEVVFKELKNFSEDVDEMLKDEVSAVAKEAKHNLDTNPNIPKRTGKYRRSFRLNKVADGTGYRRYKLRNIKYQITHLLEDGHDVVLKSGVKTGKRTRAFPHWKYAQEIIDTLPERLKRRLEER